MNNTEPKPNQIETRRSLLLRWWRADKQPIPPEHVEALQETAWERLSVLLPQGYVEGELSDHVHMLDDDPLDGVAYSGWWAFKEPEPVAVREALDLVKSNWVEQLRTLDPESVVVRSVVEATEACCVIAYDEYRQSGVSCHARFREAIASAVESVLPALLVDLEQRLARP